jgi:hypothetical protein
MKRAGFILTILCLITLMPAVIFAKDCESMSYTDCQGVITELEEHAATMDVRIVVQWPRDTVVYNFQSGPQKLTIVVKGISTPGSSVFHISYLENGQQSTADFTPAMLASGDFTTFSAISQAIDPSFLGSVRQVIQSLPEGTPNLATFKRLGSVIVVSIGAAASSPQRLPILDCGPYAACYWGCVLGGGGFQACGPVCAETHPGCY